MLPLVAVFAINGTMKKLMILENAQSLDLYCNMLKFRTVEDEIALRSAEQVMRSPVH